jgi:hypothetical protein
VELISVEARRARRQPDPIRWISISRAWRARMSGTPTNLGRARDLFAPAVALDPANVDAVVEMAHCDEYLGGGLLGEDRTARLAAAETTLSPALSIAPNNAFAHQNRDDRQALQNSPTLTKSKF